MVDCKKNNFVDVDIKERERKRIESMYEREEEMRREMNGDLFLRDG